MEDVVTNRLQGRTGLLQVASSRVLVAVMTMSTLGALAEAAAAEPPERVVFSFDDGLAGWVLGGKAPTYTARITKDPGSWKSGGGAAEIRYQAGEKVLFGTDCLNQGPPPGLLQRIFGGSPAPRAPLVDVSSMAGFAFDVWSEAGTMLFLNVAERSGARYVFPFEVRAGEWQHVRVPLTGFTLAGDSSDDDGKLDGDQLYALALGDLRSFTSGDSPANRVRVDSLAVWDASGGAASSTPAPGAGAPSVGERIRVRGASGAQVARAGERLDVVGAGEGRVAGTGSPALEVAWADAVSGAVAPTPSPEAAPSRTGLYRVTSRLRGADGAIVASGTDTVAVVPAARTPSWLGACVLSDLASVERAGANPTLAHAAGITWDRPIVSWKAIERARGEDTWDDTDRLIHERVEQGFELAPMLAHAPEWAGSDKSGDAPPTDLAALESFAERLTRRYREQVRYWTLGNEPNWGHTKMPAKTYVGLLAAFHRGVKRADPDVKVLIAGIAFIDLDYVEALYDAGAASHFDVMNLHPYAFPAPPEDENGSGLLERTTGVEASVAGIKKVQALMTRRGDGNKALWITEISWGSGQAASDLEAKFRPFMVDPPTQARYYARAALLSRAWGAERFFLLAVPELPDAAASLFARSGVVEPDGTPKPALVALATLAHEVGDARLVGEVSGLPGGARGVEFERGGARVLALWSTAGQVKVRVPAAGSVTRAVDGFGRPIEGEVTSSDGAIVTTADELPRYLHVAEPAAPRSP